MTIDGKTINDLYKLRVGLVSAEDAGLIHEGISDDLFCDALHSIGQDYDWWVEVCPKRIKNAPIYV